MKKKQNKSSSKRIKNIVSAALLASICLSLTAFTPAESKNTVLASKKTSKSKEGSTAWDNLLPKDAKKNSDTVTELDVIICEYGQDTKNWFLGSGMKGSNFVKKFEEENPNIKLNLEVVSWSDVYDEVDKRIKNGNAPDILNLDVYSDYAEDGLLLPVKDYCPTKLYSDFFSPFLDQSSIDGKVWALPDLASSRALYCNADIFKEVGIDYPTTWDELEDACGEIKKYYKGKVYPWGIDMTTDEGQAAFSYYTWGNGGGFVDDKGKWAVNSSENVEALEFAIGLVDKGYTNPKPATETRYDLQDMFAEGKLAMLIGPNQLPAYVEKKGGNIKMVPVPIPAAKGKTSSSIGVMDRIMAFRDDDASDQDARNEAIGEFMTFFFAPENYTAWVEMEGFLPVVKSGVKYMAKYDTNFGAWLDILDNCKFYPTEKAEWAQAKKDIIAAEQNALNGNDVKKELDKVQKKLN